MEDNLQPSLGGDDVPSYFPQEEFKLVIEMKLPQKFLGTQLQEWHIRIDHEVTK